MSSDCSTAGTGSSLGFAPGTKLGIEHPGLSVLAGQLSDQDAVRAAFTGSDAVISALGQSLKSGATGNALTDDTRTVVTAMKGIGVRRFIGLARAAACPTAVTGRS